MISHRLAAILLMSIPGAAQWLNYPTPGIPRTAEGKPNLSAPAPRTPDGKPDLSGFWRTLPSKYTQNITADLKPGDIQPWVAAASKKALDDKGKAGTGVSCLPPGPRISFNQVKILPAPGLTALLYEADGNFIRQVYTDGRTLPKEVLNPSWQGYSVGHWDGDTFVIETAGFNTRSTLDAFAHPHTESLRITERMRRRDVGHMDLQITYNDPEAYNKAWTVPFEMRLLADDDLLENVCTENERDRDHMVGKGEDHSIKVAPAILSKYAGTYQIRPGREITITLAGDQLMAEQGAMGRFPISAETETLFLFEPPAQGPPSKFEFVKNAQGAITSLIWHTNRGDDLPAVRR
jgi:hypothetical protein